MHVFDRKSEFLHFQSENFVSHSDSHPFAAMSENAFLKSTILRGGRGGVIRLGGRGGGKNQNRSHFENRATKNDPNDQK